MVAPSEETRSASTGSMETDKLKTLVSVSCAKACGGQQDNIK
jgi:hypothetical protein